MKTWMKEKFLIANIFGKGKPFIIRKIPCQGKNEFEWKKLNCGN